MKSRSKMTKALLGGVVRLLVFALVGLAATQAFAQGDTWATKADLLVAHAGYGAAVNGKLYVVSAGWVAGHNNVQEYDPGTDTWTFRAPILNPVGEAAAAALDGKLYVIGGCPNANCASVTNLLQVYDPVTNTWDATKAPMPTPRGTPAAAAIGGKLYVVGGHSAGFAAQFNTLQVYDPATNTWATKAPMPTARDAMAAAAIDGQLYVVGGILRPGGNVVTGVLEVYDPATDTWDTTNAPMPTSRFLHGVGVLDGKLHVVGGHDLVTGALTTHEAYDPATDTWVTRASMPTPRALVALSVIDSLMYVAGGSFGAVGADIKLEVYTPAITEITVAIDIKPGSFPNSINPRGKGTIPVAILTTDTFDATTVDETTVLFGATGTEAAPVHAALEDVDLDGDTDLILHFNTQDTGIQCGDTSASLTGETFGGQMIEGSDSIKTAGCK